MSPVPGVCPPVPGVCPPVPGVCHCHLFQVYVIVTCSRCMSPVPGVCPPVPGVCLPVPGVCSPPIGSSMHAILGVSYYW